jgi:4-diphosphocytidyl-2-C-methyl-D-erythritol kinase
MRVRRRGSCIEVLAPAKINLFLRVLGKRPDGYHELETLMVPVAVYDTLLFFPREEGGVELACRWAWGRAAAAHTAAGGASDIPTGADNLAYRAVELVRRRYGVKKGARLELTKRIPAEAGLGGASSDATAALAAANAGWELGLSRDELAEMAAELGSDVPFFLQIGGAWCRARGERLSPAATPPMHVVVVRPPEGLSTAKVYRAWQPSGQMTEPAGLSTALARGNMTAAAGHLANSLQQPAASLSVWIGRLQCEFERQGLLGHQMSGSGSSYFGLCRTARQARRVAARLRARNLGVVFATRTEAA